MLVACLTACATAPGVVSTDARSSRTGAATTVPGEGSTPTDSAPEDTTATSGPTAPVPTLSVPTTSVPTTSVGTSAPPLDATGIGDELYPALGNPGIDVEHYTLALNYDPSQNEISANAHLEIVMTADRDRFSLDSDGPNVSAVSIDGVRVDFVADPPELLITPAARLTKGQRVGVDVTYTLSPQPVPSDSGDQVGWFPTPRGSYVLNEPEGARTWLPCNDHPSDKATFRFELTVPSGVTAVANGALVDQSSTGTTDTWVWQEDNEMAPYTILLLTGDYELVEGVGPNGLPLLSAVLRDDRTKMQAYLDSIDDQVDFFDDFFGAYPFDRYGIAIADSVPGLAMETTERSMFSREDFASGRLDSGQELYLSHELVHQWFGDAVSPARWIDVWLNESFATYGEWMWLDHLGQQSIDDAADAGLVARMPRSTARPSAADLFGFNSYEGGAVILHALRKTIGDDQFFTLLRRWVADNEGTSRTTADFVALANEVAGQDLTAFFATWLYADVVPTTFPT